MMARWLKRVRGTKSRLGTAPSTSSPTRPPPKCSLRWRPLRKLSVTCTAQSCASQTTSNTPCAPGSSSMGIRCVVIVIVIVLLVSKSLLKPPSLVSLSLNVPSSQSGGGLPRVSKSSRDPEHGSDEAHGQARRIPQRPTKRKTGEKM